MKKSKIPKTNALRILDHENIPYEILSYAVEGNAIDAIHVAEKIGHPEEKVFKTLVAKGASGSHYVFVIPGNQSLNLKKAAQITHEKNISMVAVKELQSLTGYVRGGCSPIGMKKKFDTYLSDHCLLFDALIVSGGKIGIQMIIKREDLVNILKAVVADITD